MKITKSSSSFWEGNPQAESLQRVYGISFPDSKQLKEWEKFQEEAAKRDHRKVGRDQDLFFFHNMSPGSAFWYPKGAHIYNSLTNFIRKEYRKRGFMEVRAKPLDCEHTPTCFRSSRRTCTTQSCGSSPVTGSIMRKTCSSMLWPS